MDEDDYGKILPFCASAVNEFQMAKIAMIGINDKKINTYLRRRKNKPENKPFANSKPCKWQFRGV
jgi:hypothetical protein